jgi:subfamily B ATP-binding cassette protein HlyB/CyaB
MHFQAYIVMNPSAGSGQAGSGETFTIGMLVAFQMFASRLSQPMQRVLLGLQPLTTTAYSLRVLRLVGLWQQFQQASLSVQRMGDIMNAPTEPYSILPTRLSSGNGQIDIDDLSFRYADNLPFLYQGFKLKVAPGKVIAVMGPSGSGKSTLTKLLQGFYQPSGGTIKIDSNDIRYLSANELRHYFGVVPQETILFWIKQLATRLGWQNTPAKSLVIRHDLRQPADGESPRQLRASGTRLQNGGDPHRHRSFAARLSNRDRLSGGQKQRIAIARALLKQPKILIFDEATSSLDATTAEHFVHTINQLKGKVTMMFISHAVPKNLLIDDVIRIGQGGLSAVGETGGGNA